MPSRLAVDHDRIRFVDRDVFLLPFAPDCLAHTCRCRDEGGRVRLDACCRYGVDVTQAEREAILASAGDVATRIAPALRDPARWFDDSEPELDPEVTGGVLVRTGVLDPRDEASGCVFLRHDGRGCALHEAGVKPEPCRLYPLAWGGASLELADDFRDYSCAHVGAGPSVYRVVRATLAEVFDRELVRALDRVERTVLGRALPLVARM